MAETRKSKGPKVGSLAWEKQLYKNPIFVKNTIQSLARRASQGNKQAAVTLAGLLERYPEMKPTVREIDDLRTQTETAWVKAMAGADLVLEQVIRDEVAKMTAGLLGENPSFLDRALVSNVVIAHLANQRAMMWAAQPADLPAVSSARERRVESTARRLHLAIKSLALVRGQKSRGLAPPPKFKLFEATG